MLYLYKLPNTCISRLLLAIRMGPIVLLNPAARKALGELRRPSGNRPSTMSCLLMLGK